MPLVGIAVAVCGWVILLVERRGMDAGRKQPHIYPRCFLRVRVVPWPFFVVSDAVNI